MSNAGGKLCAYGYIYFCPFSRCITWLALGVALDCGGAKSSRQALTCV